MADACRCYWLEHGAYGGAVNMAVDEWLLGCAERGSGWAVFRVYRWRRPTVSLGYFQRADSRPEHLRHLPYVRRLTGGGAILHDREITYSLCASAEHPLYEMGSERLYRRVHEVLARALAEQDLTAAPRGPVRRDRADGSEPFLCFVRRHRTDLLLDDVKVAGSAQRRRTRGLLQHGSLVLQASEYAPEVRGIADLHGGPIDVVLLLEAVRKHLAVGLGLAMQPWPRGPSCWRDVRRLVRDRYASAVWNEMR